MSISNYLPNPSLFFLEFSFPLNDAFHNLQYLHLYSTLYFELSLAFLFTTTCFPVAFRSMSRPYWGPSLYHKHKNSLGYEEGYKIKNHAFTFSKSLLNTWMDEQTMTSPLLSKILRWEVHPWVLPSFSVCLLLFLPLPISSGFPYWWSDKNFHSGTFPRNICLLRDQCNCTVSQKQIIDKGKIIWNST